MHPHRSSPLTWAGGEPPLAGDTVIIPDGQAVLLDVPAAIFLLLVQGILVVDHRDLTINATSATKAVGSG